MCRPTMMVALLLALISASTAAQSKARQEPQEIQRLQAKADSLARLWDEANALANLADSLAHSGAPPRLDTLRVGSLVIVANRSPLPLRAAAERAWPVIDSMYGSRARELKQHPYLIHAIDPDSLFRVSNRWGTLIPWDKSAKELADLLYVYLPGLQPDKAFKDWAGVVIRPSTSSLPIELQLSYVALVTSHYSVGRECFVGSLESCRSLLGLDWPFDPVKQFRTSAERKEAVGGMVFGYSESQEMAAMKPCTSGDDSVCVRVIRQVDPSRLPSMMGPIVRQTLVRMALSLGGKEAYARLTADSTLPMDQRLTAAAGVPLDSLLSFWQSSVIAARPKSVELPVYGPVVGLAWVLLFGTVALRSSRWRVA